MAFHSPPIRQCPVVSIYMTLGLGYIKDYATFFGAVVMEIGREDKGDGEGDIADML